MVAFGALLLRLNAAFGEPTGRRAPVQALIVMFAHLALVFTAGIYLPPALCRVVPTCCQHLWMREINRAPEGNAP